MQTTIDHLMPDWLARCAQNYPERLAVMCGQVRWNFAELDAQVTRMARQLAGVGVQAGDRVALLAANGASYVTLVHALTRLGAVLVPLNTRLTVAELRWQMHDVSPTLLISDRQHGASAAKIAESVHGLARMTLAASKEGAVEDGAIVLDNVPEAAVSLRSLIDLNAPQAILYTSGTSGQPKGALITYGMQWWNAIGSALNLGLRGDDRWLACLPLFHIGGLSILVRSVIYGIGVIVQEKFDAAAVNRAIIEERVTIISVVSVMLQRMLTALDGAEDCGSYPTVLRCVLLGGGPAPQALLEDCARRGIPVVQTYGLTESCSQAVTLSPDDALRKLGSAGRPLLPVQLCIARVSMLADSGGDLDMCAPGGASAPPLGRDKSGPYGDAGAARGGLGDVASSIMQGEMGGDDGGRPQGSPPLRGEERPTAKVWPDRGGEPPGRGRPQGSPPITTPPPPLREGEPGEILLRGPTITPGYINRPDETARAFVDGWFATGDIGYVDADGYLYVLDRRSDVIISGGENVYPAEVEAVLLAHPAVREAGVCGQDDVHWGQVPVAFVHLHAGSAVSAPALLAYAAQRLARYKLPRVIYITGELPRNAAGKLLRRELPRLVPSS